MLIKTGPLYPFTAPGKTKPLMVSTIGFCATQSVCLVPELHWYYMDELIRLPQYFVI